MKYISKSASALGKIGGKIGGKSTSERKRAAVRENGRLGGRPVGPRVLRTVTLDLPESVALRMDIRTGDLVIVGGRNLLRVALMQRSVEAMP